jgi:membrane protease YdiL (CAAX protease family)
MLEDRAAALTPEQAGDARARVVGLSGWHEHLAEVAQFACHPRFRAEPLAWRQGGARALVTAGAVHLGLALLVMVPLWLWGRDSGLLPSPIQQEAAVAEGLFSFVIVAPLTEELLFRGWLTGRRAGLRFAAYGLAALALMLGGVLAGAEWARWLSLAGAAIAFAGLIHWGLTRQRDRAVPAWFIARFSPIVWGSTLLFGLIHLGNYSGLTNPLGLLVVLPQVLGGLLLAYIRTRSGLVAAILYHACYNGLFVGLSLAGALRP